MKTETWKDIKGYEGLYMVSSLGNIKSLAKTKRVKRSYTTKELVIIPTKPSGKYHKIALFKNEKLKSFYIHRLVAASFILNPESKPQVNHINGIKTDNHVENLEWCTVSENVLHAYKTGLSVRVGGEKHPLAKLSAADVNKIKELSTTGISQGKIGKLYGVSQTMVGLIINNKRRINN